HLPVSPRPIPRGETFAASVGRHIATCLLRRCDVVQPVLPIDLATEAPGVLPPRVVAVTGAPATVRALLDRRHRRLRSTSLGGRCCPAQLRQQAIPRILGASRRRHDSARPRPPGPTAEPP